jgi:hypothetical protein
MGDFDTMGQLRDEWSYLGPSVDDGRAAYLK